MAIVDKLTDDDIQVLYEIIDLLESGEIVRGLPKPPESYTHFEWRSAKVGELYVATKGYGKCLISPPDDKPLHQIIACRSIPCGTDYLDIMESGAFMWEGKKYFLHISRNEVTGADVVEVVPLDGCCTAVRAGTMAWEYIQECFGTSDISGLCEASVRRPTGWV